MKTVNQLVLMVALIGFTSVGLAQKPKKTFDSAVFAKKVKFSFTPEYVTSRSPNAAAMAYISEKTGKKLIDVEDEEERNQKLIKADLQEFAKSGLIFTLDKTEEKLVKEAPVKRADITLFCSSGDTKFTIILANCIQTNISWYLGDRVYFEGDMFPDLAEQKAAIRVPVEVDLPQVQSHKDSVALEKMGLPLEMYPLSANWEFKAIYEGDVDVTESYENGFINGRPIHMDLWSDGSIMYWKGYRDRNNISYAEWSYLTDENKKENEKEIDFVLKLYNPDGGYGKEKYSIVSVSDTELIYENKKLNIRYVWTR